MDMIRNRLIPIVGAGALVAVVAIAMAGDDEEEKDKKEEKAEREGRGGADRGERGERKFRGATKLCRRLKCDESQDEPLKEIISTFKDKKRAADKEIREQRKLFAEAYGADEVDDTKMREAEAAILAQRKATIDAAHEGLIELHGLLSPEQRESLAKVVSRGGPLEPYDERLKGSGKRGRDKGDRSRGRKDRRGRDDSRRAARVDPRRSKEASRKRGGKPLSDEEREELMDKRAEMAKEAGKEAG